MADKNPIDVAKREAPTPTSVERTRERPLFVPPTDIYETDNTVVLLADMPGVDEKSVDIRLEKGVLTIHGRVDEPSLEGYTLAYAEYGTGDYERAFTLSEEVDTEKISATMKNGVLRLELAKREAARPKTIKVKVG